MSLGARTAKGGAKAGKEKPPQEKKTDKPAPKEKVKPQATTEQLRMAHMIDRKSEDASDVRRMVLELMEMTRRTEEEVCSALHDTDNDMDLACNLLFEDAPRIQGEWQTREKKKKKPTTTGNGSASPPPPARAPRRREARGRGAARARGARPPRRPRRPAWPEDGSGPAGGTAGDSFPATEDWDNEEWSGSLSDTKVFTPSASAQPAADGPPAAPEEWEGGPANGPGEAHIPTYTYHNTHAHYSATLEQMSTPSQPAGSQPPAAPAPAPDADTYHHQPMGMSGSLSAAQSQYLSQLTQQSQRHDSSVYSSNYVVYGSSDITSQRKPQRARVPPPSKIPSLAVEMPPGEAGLFLDVQFGVEPDLEPPVQTVQPQPVTSQPESTPAPPHEAPAEVPNSTYSNTNSMLSESLSVVDTTPASQPVTSESIVTNSTTSLEKQLSASMKQLSVSAAEHHHHAYSHPPHRPKQQTVSQQNVYAHHAVSHHPPVYGANVYAPQVNSTNASLTGASAMTATAYPSSVTLTQYQPMINSYQTSSSATVYGGSALYTAAPYSAAYQPTPPPKMQPKDNTQYESSVAPSNSLTNTSTTQTTTAKVTTTTVSSGSGANTGAGAGYAAGALYGAGSAPYAYDETQMMRSTLPHHMGGYYEVGYGVNVGAGSREGTFGLGAGDRFSRTDAASPQQVPAAALPPGYAYFYQPPPTTYQYGVYPYGGGSSVGGVGGVGSVGSVGGVSSVGSVSAAPGKLASYAPPYDAQDSYKPGGPYNSNATKTGGGAAADLTNAMYAKTHVALNKVNSYEKAGFHSGTPPPFGAGSHLYIPAPHHHHPHHHHPPQMDVRGNSSHNRRESGGAGGRSSSSKPAASKPAYSQSYWAPN